MVRDDPFTKEEKPAQGPTQAPLPGPANDPDFKSWQAQQQGGTGGGPSFGINPQTGQGQWTTPPGWGTSAPTGSVAANAEIFEAEDNSYLSFLNGGLFGKPPGKPTPKQLTGGYEADATADSGTMTIGEAMKVFYGWSTDKVRDLARRLVSAGYDKTHGINENSTREDVWKALGSLLRDAAAMHAANPSAGTTVDLLLKGYEKNPISGAATGQVASGPQTALSLTNPSQAKSILKDAITQQLGRAPTKAEHAAFLAALNEEERDNPITSTQTRDPGTGEVTSGVTSGGVNQVSFADDFILGDEELAQDKKHYQMATSLMGALEGALGATVGP